MGADEDDRSQAGGAAMASKGSGNANGGADRRARRGRGARAQTPQRQGETTGGKTTKARVSTTRTRTKRAHGRPTEYPGSSGPWARDPDGTRRDRAVAQTDLSGCQAHQELGHQMPREGGQKTAAQEQAGA